MKKVIYALLSWVFIMIPLAAQTDLDESIKILHGPYLQNVGSDEATIVWVSDKPSIAWVELAPDGNDSFYTKERPRFYDTRDGIKTISRIHSVKLKNLKAGTTYRYRVYVQHVLQHKGISVIYGKTAATNVYTKNHLNSKPTTPANLVLHLPWCVISTVTATNYPASYPNVM